MGYGHGILKRMYTDIFEEEVIPKRGAIVYCKLVGIPIIASPDHSGIYVGNGEIVELDGDGLIQRLNYKRFAGNGPDGSITRLGFAIYVACDERGRVLAREEIANRAEKLIGSTRSYNVVMDNCHQFSAGCLTGSMENSNNFLWMLQDEVRKVYGIEKVKWRVMKGSTDY